MAAKKTSTRKKTAQKKATTPINARRVGPETLAKAAWARGPDFWATMVAAGMRMAGMNEPVAQVMPREDSAARH